MPIEISILSGTRQGDCLRLDSSVLRVGDKSSCDVYFDAQHDREAKGRSVTLKRTDDGWNLKNEGKESVWVNHEPVSQTKRIRSGDIVRLSELGPDFSFTIVSASEPAPATAHTADRKGGGASPRRSDRANEKDAADHALHPDQESTTADTPSESRPASTAASAEPARVDQPAMIGDGARRWVVVATIALGLATVVVVGAWILSPPPVPSVRPPRLPEELGEQTIREGEEFNLSAGVLDPNDRVGTLRYSLLAGGEDGIQIDPETGNIRWTTGEEHGPKEYEVTVQVLAASEDRQASDEKTYVLTVLEENRPPRFGKIPDKTIRLHQDGSLNIELPVSDPDEPANRLKLALVSDVPEGVQLDTETRKIFWRPTPEQAGIHTLTVRVEDDGSQPLTDETSFDVEVIKPDPWAVAEEKARRWTMLLVGEAPDTGEVFPFGTAVVFDTRAVVTNGVLAAELAKRMRNGWKVRVLNPTDQSEASATRILVHKAFELSQEQPAEQIYFDVGIVEVQEEKPFQDIGQLASPSVLASLERGQPVACVAISHDGLPMTRFSRLEAEFAKCSIYLMTQVTPGSNDPNVLKLLHLTGKLPSNIFGSPIINVDGQVIGIYAESAAKPVAGDAATIDDLHYAVSPSLVEAWRKGQGTEYWKTPTVGESPQESETGANEKAPRNGND